MPNKSFIALLLGAIAIVIPGMSLASTSASDMISITGTSAGNKLGRAVASGDFNGDGFQDLVAGASGNSSYITITYGTAEILPFLTVSTSNTAVLSVASSTDFFGNQLATGDINGDGYDDIVVGASGDTAGGAAAGAFYVIYGKSTGYLSETVSADATIAKFISNAGFNLGASVAVGDINGDGYDDIAVGQSSDSTGVAGGGSVVIKYGSASQFIGMTNSIVTAAKFTGEAASDAIGSALAIGDLNGDGFEDIVVGVAGNHEAGIGAGAMYIVYGQTVSFSGSNSIGGNPEFTGEAAGDAFGTSVAVSNLSIDGDVYNDIIVGATGNDDGAAGAGAAYLIPGSATAATGTTAATASTVLEFNGTTASDNIGFSVASADLNQDGYNDVIIGSSAATSSTGAVYVLNGSASLVSESIASANVFSGISAGDTFGKSISTGDLNGDSFPELLVGASGYSAGVETGVAYIGYLYIDADGDGVPSSEGLWATVDTTIPSDCSDTDAAVSTAQTYYPDADADGLGDPNGTVASVCSSTAPTGYVSNSLDTNDTIPNNGVEIGGDGIDNDGDSEIDEHNTITENGAHPYYSTLTVSSSATGEITDVEGAAGGVVSVTYADGSVYDYTVFNSSTTKLTKVEQFKTTGYAVVLNKKATKVFLLNMYTGVNDDHLQLGRFAADSKDLLLGDLRADGSTEAVVSTKINNTVHVYLIHIKKLTGKISLYDKTLFVSKKVVVSKTKIHNHDIQMRSSGNKILESIFVTKNYSVVLSAG